MSFVRPETRVGVHSSQISFDARQSEAGIRTARCPAASERWLHLFRFNRAMVGSGLMGLTGILMLIPIVTEYGRFGLRLPEVGTAHHLAVTGLFFLITGFLTFATTLVVNASTMRLRPRKRR